jgi:hypothetical protein
VSTHSQITREDSPTDLENLPKLLAAESCCASANAWLRTPRSQRVEQRLHHTLTTCTLLTFVVVSHTGAVCDHAQLLFTAWLRHAVLCCLHRPG